MNNTINNSDENYGQRPSIFKMILRVLLQLIGPFEIFTEQFFKILNILLLVLNAVITFGIIEFYYGLYDVKSYQKAILIAWIILILSVVVIKEFKVKALGKRLLLNIALYMAMVGNPYFYFFIW